MSESVHNHNRSIISREDLWDLMKQLHPDLSRESMDWFVYNCQEQNIFKRIGRNMYTLAGSELDKEPYVPGETKEVREVRTILDRSGTEFNYQIWDSGQLEEFMPDCRTLPRIVITEVEKGQMEQAFDLLRRQLLRSVQFKPDRRYFKKYMEEGAVIVLPLPSESPRHRSEPHAVRLEKLLVDLLANKLLLELIDEESRTAVYRTAFDCYLVDESTLFRYARRRNKEAVVREFIRDHAGIQLLGE